MFDGTMHPSDRKVYNGEKMRDQTQDPAKKHSTIPNIDIIDYELLSPEERRELASMLLTTFGASRETCFDMVGISLEDEINKRRSEKEKNCDEIFTPYQSSYTYTNKNDSGRPSSDDVGTKAKRDYDEQYNKNSRV